MTDDVLRPAPDDPDPIDPHARDDRPDQPDEVGVETDVPTQDAVLKREGADAPDAADIADPERQL